jgi:hypothetical protein
MADNILVVNGDLWVCGCTEEELGCLVESVQSALFKFLAADEGQPTHLPGWSV